ncbi:MAG: FtsX-like permease family protein [Pseudomonadota bacterium]
MRASLRFYRQHPLQLALTLLGIALGAAVIVAVALATRAAAVSFDRSLDVLAGPMTHEIRAHEGAVDENLYRWLRVDRGLRDVVPVVRLRVTVDGSSVDLVGTDPFALIARDDAPPAAGNALAALLTEAGAVQIPVAIAERFDLVEGEPIEASVAGRGAALNPVAIFESTDGEWFGNTLLADISTAQHLGGRHGELDSIQLRLSAPGAADLAARLPDAVELRAFDDQRQTFDDMTRAFRTNLTAMSLLAVLVGAFLVYNAMAFAVVQRTPSFAVLRMLGTLPTDLFRLLLIEALGLGLIGGVLGLMLGTVLGQGLLVLVTRTVSDLFVSVDALRPDFSLGQLLLALSVTLAAVLLATLAPARAAARTAPAALERESRAQSSPSARRLLLPGLLLVLACPIVIVVSGQSLLAAFVGLFLLVAGYALLCPLALRLSLAALVHGGARVGGTALQLSLRGVQSALPRTGPALVALAVAVSATVGVAIMIGSFRISVADWLGDTLQGDLYVYLDAEGARLDPAWQASLEGLPGVSSAAAARVRTLSIDGESMRVLALDRLAAEVRSFDIVAGPEDAGQRMLEDGRGILVSEPLARRRGLSLGDALILATPRGAVELTLRGVYRDYASSYGGAVVAQDVFARYFSDQDLSSLALRLDASADAAALQQQIRDLGAAEGLDLVVVSNRSIRERSLEIFDRTFLITDVLRALVVVVAFVGILSALLALFLERRRELAVLRATGLTPRQLFALVLRQAALSGVLAGLLALPLGAAMSVLLIDVINRRSFGWTLQMHFDLQVVLHALLLSVAAAAMAAVLPARRLAVSDLRDALYDP